MLEHTANVTQTIHPRVGARLKSHTEAPCRASNMQSRADVLQQLALDTCTVLAWDQWPKRTSPPVKLWGRHGALDSKWLAANQTLLLPSAYFTS